MIAARVGRDDRELVAAVRVGDDSAFEELYRRYHHRVAAYVRGMVRDDARAEDLAQDAFFSALRRMRATDAPIAFKPWIFEIARNAAIDHWRRTGRAEEVSVDALGLLRRSDRSRLAAAPPPETAVIDMERLGHLRGALDELPEVQTRVLMMRELEGMSYREIAERLDLSRTSVETALFRARRRLEAEYTDISEGRRCVSMRAVMMRLAEGGGDGRGEERLARHARRCHSCRRRAHELGVKPLGAPGRLSRKTAALLPLPFLSSGAGSQAA
ncbi:MAG: sigma-70 family RNA polymerase sigma factor, partial [Thermoleophilaceae bacterium]